MAEARTVSSPGHKPMTLCHRQAAPRPQDSRGLSWPRPGLFPHQLPTPRRRQVCLPLHSDSSSPSASTNRPPAAQPPWEQNLSSPTDAGLASSWSALLFTNGLKTVPASWLPCCLFLPLFQGKCLTHTQWHPTQILTHSVTLNRAQRSIFFESLLCTPRKLHPTLASHRCSHSYDKPLRL